METVDLVTAISRGDISALIKAVEAGHDVVGAYFLSETALHIACHVGDLAILTYLLDSGADVNVKTTDSQESPLHVACREGHVTVARTLLERSADVNAFMLHRSTPLRVACVKGHLDIVQLLISHGADVDVAERTGRTPLLTAVEQGHLDVVEVLLRAGCNKDAQDSLGRNAVFHAVRKRYGAIVRTLAAAKCDVNALDKRGVSPLHCVARMGFFDMIRILLEAGCDKDIQGHLGGEGPGYTPLWESIQSGHLMAVEILLKAGADPGIGDHYTLGNSLFAMMMSNHCRLDILHMLVDFGVNVNYQNAYGYSALRFAIDKGWFDAAKLLVLADCDVAANINWIKEYQAIQEISADFRDFIEWTLSSLSHPKSLKHLCRLEVRKLLRLSKPLSASFEHLPVPNMIKNYLKFCEVSS